MKIVGTGNLTYIFLSGIRVKETLKLSDYVELEPADSSHLDLNTALAICRSPIDIPVLTAFIPRITSQLKVSADGSKELAVRAWNSLWDVSLLSALLRTEIGFDLQSDKPACDMNKESYIRVTNHNMISVNPKKAYEVSEEDKKWLKNNFTTARSMLDHERFMTAVHCPPIYILTHQPLVRKILRHY